MKALPKLPVAPVTRIRELEEIDIANQPKAVGVMLIVGQNNKKHGGIGEQLRRRAD